MSLENEEWPHFWYKYKICDKWMVSLKLEGFNITIENEKEHPDAAFFRTVFQDMIIEYIKTRGIDIESGTE